MHERYIWYQHRTRSKHLITNKERFVRSMQIIQIGQIHIHSVNEFLDKKIQYYYRSTNNNNNNINNLHCFLLFRHWLVSSRILSFDPSYPSKFYSYIGISFRKNGLNFFTVLPKAVQMNPTKVGLNFDQENTDVLASPFLFVILLRSFPQ